MKKLFSLCVLFLCISAFSQTYTVDLSWSSSTSSGVTGYNIYFGQNTNNWLKTSLGNITNTTLTLTNNTSYILAVTAYNSTQESPISDIVSIPSNAPITKVLNLSWIEVTNAGITIEATNGTIVAPMVISNNCIYQASQILEGGTNKPGTASYSFSIVTAGTYVVQGFISAPSGGNDSLYLNIDNPNLGEPTNAWKVTANTGFSNSLCSWIGNGAFNAPEYNPVIFTLTAGNHTLYIAGRESYTYMQSFEILPYNTNSLGNIEILETANLNPPANWSVYTNVSSPPVNIPVGNGNEFFRLSAAVPLEIIENSTYHLYP